jgi:hypothetical protein
MEHRVQEQSLDGHVIGNARDAAVGASPAVAG